MPSFTRSVLEPDGVHLTPFSGMEYILFLFKSSEELVQRLDLSAPEQVASLSEDARVLQDRVLVLEHDHRRLADRFEHQRAIDSEMSDFQENIRNESFFMIRGLPRLPKMDPKEWQTRAKSDVSGVLRRLDLDHPILFIQNVSGRGKEPVMHYKVRMQTSEIARAIRDKFSSFFHDGKDSRPSELTGISVRNCVTPATLGRIAILQLLGRRYTASNKGSKFQVIGYESRPLLKLTPPPGVQGPRVQTFTYIEAIQKLPTSFTPAEVTELLKRISPKLHGSLKEVFGVITDDMVRTNNSRSRGTRDSGPPASEVSGSESSPASGSRGRSKRGAPSPASGPSAKK